MRELLGLSIGRDRLKLQLPNSIMKGIGRPRFAIVETGNVRLLSRFLSSRSRLPPSRSFCTHVSASISATYKRLPITEGCRAPYKVDVDGYRKIDGWEIQRLTALKGSCSALAKVRGRSSLPSNLPVSLLQQIKSASLCLAGYVSVSFPNCSLRVAIRGERR